jgi:hypothetical protein
LFLKGEIGLWLLKIEIHTFNISSETTGSILTKLGWKGPWVVLFKNCIRQAHSNIPHTLVQYGFVVSEELVKL